MATTLLLFVASCRGQALILHSQGYGWPVEVLGFREHLLVLDQRGLIFLDGSPWWKIEVSAQGESGLLSAATDNRRLWVHYTDPSGDTVVAELFSGREVFRATHPSRFHRGGSLTYSRGSLWLSLGDGTQGWRSQDPTVPQGGVLRIDPDRGTWQKWHLGLRNPWRHYWSGEDMVVIDVGSGALNAEEVNRVRWKRRSNFGWPSCEGPCNLPGFADPVLWYPRSTGNAITGYAEHPVHGILATDWSGRYLRWDGNAWVQWALTAQLPSGMSTVGERVFVTMRNSGRVYVVN